VHRPNYVVPVELPVLRNIYDRYLAAIPLMDGSGDEVGPLDRLQLLCSEGKNIGGADIRADLRKLDEASHILYNLREEVKKLL
jgi:hypothetical protein